MEVRQIKISSFLAKYLSFKWSPISGTQGVKLPNLTLLKQTGNKQAISAFHISQTASKLGHIFGHASRVNERKK